MSGEVPGELLVALQRNIPLVPRPFAHLGAAFGLAESDIIDYVERCFADGTARRLGAVFEARRLGYASTLCAVAVPVKQLEASAACLTPLTAVTHCYERTAAPNLWFTLTAEAGKLAATVAAVAERLAPLRVHSLPALQRFKIEAVFERQPVGEGTRTWTSGTDSRPMMRARVPGDTGQSLAATASAAAAVLNGSSAAGGRSFDTCDRAVVRLLQASLPVVREPFAWVAAQAGLATDDLLERCRQWQAEGVIRRLGLILSHRALGLKANSLCVWPVTADRMAAAGRTAAASPFVSHAYERPPFEGFPYNLYAMVHARTRMQAERVCRGIEATAGLPPAHMLWSLLEFKKSSPVYFG